MMKLNLILASASVCICGQGAAISGRVAWRNGNPYTEKILVAELAPQAPGRGLFAILGAPPQTYRIVAEITENADPQGQFHIHRPSNKTYRIWFGPNWANPPLIVTTQPGRDIDVGRLVMEHCPYAPNRAAIGVDTIRPPALSRSQITIDPASSHEPVRKIESPVNFEPPQCSAEPLLLSARRLWEGLNEVRFARDLSVAEFVGGEVKSIKIVRAPLRSREDATALLERVWSGTFGSASSTVNWAESTSWDFEAIVAFTGGIQIRLVTDGGHVAVEDRDRKVWYLRLRPAV